MRIPTPKLLIWGLPVPDLARWHQDSESSGHSGLFVEAWARAEVTLLMGGSDRRQRVTRAMRRRGI